MFIKLHYENLVGRYAMLVNVDKVMEFGEQDDGRTCIYYTDPDFEIVVEESLEEVEKLISQKLEGIAQKL